jgi:hypothetical protein
VEGGGEREREGSGAGGKMAQTMYAHVNKWIKTLKNKLLINLKKRKRLF